MSTSLKTGGKLQAVLEALVPEHSSEPKLDSSLDLRELVLAPSQVESLVVSREKTSAIPLIALAAQDVAPSFSYRRECKRRLTP